MLQIFREKRMQHSHTLTSIAPRNLGLQCLQV